jgi:GDPmannose 4,6-dehydratase
MKTALITGITGMVGSHLVDFLLKETDWSIYGLIRWDDKMDNIEHLTEKINNKERIQLVYGDINDLSSLLHCFSKTTPDYVFHLAAQSYPKTSFDSPLETLETNVLGTAKILEAIRVLKLDPIIHVCASSEVFGRVSKELLPIHEDIAFHPASPYAISKAGTDLIGRFYGEAYGLTVMTTRMFTHTGPRRGDVFAEYYNIGGSYSCSVGEMLNYLISISTHADIKIETDPERLRPIDADLQIPDTTKFKAHTGWAPEITFEKTMQDLLDYWRTKIKSGRRYLDR